MQVVPYKKEGYQLLHDGAICFSEMHQHGIHIDSKHLKGEYKRLKKEISNLSKLLESHEEVKIWKRKYKDNFSFESDVQLSDILFKELHYEPTKFTKTGNPSVDKEALSALHSSFTDRLLKLRFYSKIQNTYLKSLIEETCNGYIHPFLNLQTARTYRSSGSFPNVQNQPIRDAEAGEIIRKAFIPREGRLLVGVDYGGIEVKTAALYHQDPTMLGYLRNPEEADMHADFACLIFKLDDLDTNNSGENKLRKATKNSFTFPQFYGDYYKNNATGFWEWLQFSGKKIKRNEGPVIRNDITIGQHLINKGVKNFDQFVKHIKKVEHDMWNKRFPVYSKWKDKHYKEYLKNRFVTILSGFVCQGAMGKNDVINYPIQGLAFHCLLWSCIRLNKLLKKYKMKTKLIFQIHDEIVADVVPEELDDYLELLKQVMVEDLKTHWDFINVPLEIEVKKSEVDGNWFNMEKTMTYIN